MSLNTDFSDPATLEKYSAAFTLSDMEIYVFPELLYPMVLANIMSPEIWKWRDDPWFKNLQGKSFIFKINRIKQYIIDHYVFNLDLETWGLTTKEKETGRFENYVDMSQLRQSNALFGYEGDRYYFDINIRRHFGLDRYTDNVIPYWKTETVEAMNAFHFKESFTAGAGECVSLSTLYAAALFIVGRIPLENIFLMGTPLHSQNFIDIHEGVLTNNRRIVTKTMWFNGTSMSTKARRALEHERVTLVSHISGHIHHLYEKATIDPKAYRRFTEKLNIFLTTELNPAIFINFLRYHMNYKKYFQYRWTVNGREHYIPLETVFEYEHHSRFAFSETMRESLLREIDDEERIGLLEGDDETSVAIEADGANVLPGREPGDRSELDEPDVVRQKLALRRPVYLADLENLEVFSAGIDIVREGMKQAGDDGCPQHASVLGKRIFHADGFYIELAIGQIGHVGGRAKAEGYNFRKPAVF